MQLKYCWRRQKEVSVFDKEEASTLVKLFRQGMNNREKGLKGTNERFSALRTYYKTLTGVELETPNAIWSHMMRYGPDCPRCEKPLRTPKARYCAACGFGKEELQGAETLPLIQRHPHLFP